MKEKKAIVEQQEIEFLGLILSKNGIKLQSHIARKILEFPNKLNNKKQIQQFLGCLTYAGDYIPNLSKKR